MKRMGTVRDETSVKRLQTGGKVVAPGCASKTVLGCWRGARTKTISALCCLRAIQGHSGGIPISPELTNYAFNPYKWKEYILHKRISWNFQSILEWNNSRRKRE